MKQTIELQNHGCQRGERCDNSDTRDDWYPQPQHQKCDKLFSGQEEDTEETQQNTQGQQLMIIDSTAYYNKIRCL